MLNLSRGLCLRGTGHENSRMHGYSTTCRRNAVVKEGVLALCVASKGSGLWGSLPPVKVNPAPSAQYRFHL